MLMMRISDARFLFVVLTVGSSSSSIESSTAPASAAADGDMLRVGI